MSRKSALLSLLYITETSSSRAKNVYIANTFILLTLLCENTSNVIVYIWEHVQCHEVYIAIVFVLFKGMHPMIGKFIHCCHFCMPSNVRKVFIDVAFTLWKTSTVEKIITLLLYCVVTSSDSRTCIAVNLNIVRRKTPGRTFVLWTDNTMSRKSSLLSRLYCADIQCHE